MAADRADRDRGASSACAWRVAREPATPSSLAEPVWHFATAHAESAFYPVAGLETDGSSAEPPLARWAAATETSPTGPAGFDAARAVAPATSGSAVVPDLSARGSFPTNADCHATAPAGAREATCSSSRQICRGASAGPVTDSTMDTLRAGGSLHSGLLGAGRRLSKDWRCPGEQEHQDQ